MHSRPMEGEHRIQFETERGNGTASQLAVASEHLGIALESVDLEHDRALAEAVLNAVRETDRAYRLERERSTSDPRTRQVVER